MASFEPISVTDERLAKQVLDAAFRVHTQLGPGLLESVYEKCLGIELRKSGLAYESQSIVPITYDGEVIDGGLRLDLFVARRIIVELKAVDKSLLFTRPSCLPTSN